MSVRKGLCNSCKEKLISDGYVITEAKAKLMGREFLSGFLCGGFFRRIKRGFFF